MKGREMKERKMEESERRKLFSGQRFFVERMGKQVLLMLVLLTMIVASLSVDIFAVELTDENMYGKPIRYRLSLDYPGQISIDGCYVYKDDTDYVFTVLYSNGDLVMTGNGGLTPKTSFFSPSQENILINGISKDSSQVGFSEGVISYHISQKDMEGVEDISIFLFDELYNDDDSNMTIYFVMKENDLTTAPISGQLYSGYFPDSEDLISNLNTGLSSWAINPVEELKLSGIVKEEAFIDWQEGISRQEFIYLMVTLYEYLTMSEAQADPIGTFTDTEDIYALKASHIGITNGVGEGLFGPDRILDREQMTTFLIRTLELGNIEFELPEDGIFFNDHESISSWAADAVYIAKSYDIMNGLGENNFGPHRAASHEQALVIMNRLLQRFAGVRWASEFSGDRVYLKMNDELYKSPFEENIILDTDNEGLRTIYLKNMNDLDKFMEMANLSQYSIRYDQSDNPNYEGRLILNDSIYMTLDVEKLYSGVDISGEKTSIEMTSRFSTKKSLLTITENFNTGDVTFLGFENINYYDLNDERSQLMVVPIMDLLESLGIETIIDYNEEWDILEISFQEID